MKTDVFDELYCLEWRWEEGGIGVAGGIGAAGGWVLLVHWSLPIELVHSNLKVCRETIAAW